MQEKFTMDACDQGQRPTLEIHRLQSDFTGSILDRSSDGRLRYTRTKLASQRPAVWATSVLLSITHQASAKLSLGRRGPTKKMEGHAARKRIYRESELRALSLADVLRIFLRSYANKA